MNHSPTIEKPAIDLEVKEKIKEDMALEGQVTIHIDFTAKIEGSLLRIWKTTFLFSKNSAHKSKLLHHYNILALSAMDAGQFGRNYSIYTYFFSFTEILHPF